METSRKSAAFTTASLEGDWDQTSAQKAVSGILPSLPVIGVITQGGGNGYGVAQVFAAAAISTIDEYQWQKEKNAKIDYQAFWLKLEVRTTSTFR